PFPAHGSAGLFKVDPHDDFKIVDEAFALLLKTLSVLERGLGIVDGTWPNDYGQTIVRPGQHVVHGLAGVVDRQGNVGTARKFSHDVCRRAEFFNLTYAKVIGIVGHGSAPESW